MPKNAVMALTAAALLSACSSRPRDFAPTLAMPAPDEAAFQAAQAECKQLFVEGKLDSSGRLASAGGAAAAAGVVGAAGTAAVTSAATFYTAGAVLAATMVALPFVALGGGYGVAKAKQKKKERAIQQVMGGCLKERGYEVANWTRAPKARKQ